MNTSLAHWILALLAIAWPSVAAAQVEWVDPTIGGVGILLQPTRPTVHIPNSMVRMHPMRRDQLDDQIQSFPLTLISHRMGELFELMPGEATGPQTWDQEINTPYYYRTRFDDSRIQTEFTPTERAGVFRFTFPAGKAFVRLGNRHGGKMSIADDSTIHGQEEFTGMRGYVYGRWSAPVKQSYARDDRRQVNAEADAESLEFRYAISFISVEQAKRNLEQEVGDASFAEIKDRAKARWNDALGRIQVTGGTDAQRRVFYTSLYRCYERMINITEGGRYYSAFDHKVHDADRPFYVDNWLWDTYRALEPLHTLINPEMEADQVQSYVRMYQQSGWMPSFAVLWGDHACMNGNHAAAWFFDCWTKGVRDFDLESAYQGVRKNSLEATLLPWRNGPKCALDDFYNEHGYFPALRPGEPETEPMVNGFESRQAVAVTLGNAYDDWCIAQMAKELGKQEDYKLFSKRAQFYRNVWHPELKFMMPRHADGSWITNFNIKLEGGPGGRHYYDENNAYTYVWDTPHAYKELFELMGGPREAEARLDQMFREGLDTNKQDFYARYSDSTGLIGQFVAGNEPSFSIPFLYNRLGKPWKTQKRVRNILESHFTDTIFGIPGDEDGGGMTAWVVFAMIGLYPVTPGIPQYDLCSPVFDEVVISLPEGRTFKIIAENNSRHNKYIQRAELNGQELKGIQAPHDKIAAGGVLLLRMGDTPPAE